MAPLHHLKIKYNFMIILFQLIASFYAHVNVEYIGIKYSLKKNILDLRGGYNKFALMTPTFDVCW